VPLVVLAIALPVAPKSAVSLARGGWGEHLLNSGSIGLIESEDFGEQNSYSGSSSLP